MSYIVIDPKDFVYLNILGKKNQVFYEKDENTFLSSAEFLKTYPDKIPCISATILYNIDGEDYVKINNKFIPKKVCISGEHFYFVPISFLIKNQVGYFNLCNCFDFFKDILEEKKPFLEHTCSCGDEHDINCWTLNKTY